MVMTTPYRSSVQNPRDGFVQLMLAEWTKLRSVPRWSLTMLGGILVTILSGMLLAGGAGSASSGGDGATRGISPQYRDAGNYVHRVLTGDGSIVARVASQKNNDPWAKGGLMLRADAKPGAPYAALMITPGHGVRLQANFVTDIPGSSSQAPRWLKLTRTGISVTGFESADGATWTKIGTVELEGLGDQAEVGVFVASPDALQLQRQFGGEDIVENTNLGEATFDNVKVEPAKPQQLPPWRGDIKPVAPDATSFHLVGAGDIAFYHYATDSTKTMLTGAMFGMMAIVALAVLYVTSEYQQGLIWTTFTASPRRGRVLAARAVVLGGVTFVLGLVAAFGTFLLASPMVRKGNAAPATLSDPQVLRAVVGTAALLAVVAVFSLAIASILRRSAAAITVVLLLLLAPLVAGSALPLAVAKWLERLTPSAGFAIQQTLERYDTAIAPLPGLAVLCAYTAVALGFAIWRIGRQDA
ncbi:ABC transporter permease subunit [Nonomuraea lactucae]|uniref:ABC transporter permease subunit n=1 Tax=Nonomuraea lactucae TaxID=2249762 RepID=UPI000DE3CBD6|nr:ABC transporter permease subunit [Nonomuraea lactucae]